MHLISKTIFGVALLLLQIQAMGQEVLLNDSALIPPFEGVIGYRIRYEGKLNPASKPYLADSMTLFVGKNGLLYRYHGGKSADMQSQVLWDGDTQSFWLLDPSHKTAEMISDIWTGYVAKSKKLPEKLNVAGKPCTAWTLTQDKRVEKLWVNDSIYFGGELVDSLKLQQPAFLASGLRQIPLQTKRSHAEEVVTILQAVTITPGAQDKWLFKVPEGYNMGQFDPSRLQHPILKPKQE
ncbi:MAG TPA: hypothetical protein VHS96_01380 [Bacteroidia bacterium]|nr:hypothetical protein [Bacteroidia bacterium]